MFVGPNLTEPFHSRRSFIRHQTHLNVKDQRRSEKIREEQRRSEKVWGDQRRSDEVRRGQRRSGEDRGYQRR